MGPSLTRFEERLNAAPQIIHSNAAIAAEEQSLTLRPPNNRALTKPSKIISKRRIHPTSVLQPRIRNRGNSAVSILDPIECRRKQLQCLIRIARRPRQAQLFINPCDPGSVCFERQCTDRACIGVACPAGQRCSLGACSCAPGRSSCNGTCVDTAVDDANCGGCDRACANGTHCAAGTCVAADCQGQVATRSACA